MDRKLVSVREAAQFLGVTPSTLRRWERKGRLAPDERTRGGVWRYDLESLGSEHYDSVNSVRKTVPMLGCRAMTKKTTWSAKSKSWNSIALVKAGPLRSSPTRLRDELPQKKSKTMIRNG